MNPAFKRRLPTYLTGLFIGLTVLLITNQLKRAFAPKFLESSEVRKEIPLATGGKLRLKYAQEPGYLLIPGFPTFLHVGKKISDQPFRAIIQLGYRELTEREVLIGPLPEAGMYEVRSEFNICAKPGDAICVKQALVFPVLVTDLSSSTEQLINVDLEAMLKAGLVNQPAAIPTSGPSQNK